jgi:cell division protein FtsI (penicillin-binding protein 3)/stage V sporulation protein D (sporulation-specific penicillin-binding protein)
MIRRPSHRVLSFKETLAKKRTGKDFTLNDSKKRTGVMGYVILIVVLVIMGRLFWLQIVKGGTLGREAIAQIMGENVEISPRGSIVDRDGEELAVSIISKSLYVDPQEMDDNPEQWGRGKQPVRDPRQVAAEKLAPVLGIKEEELHECFANPDRRFVWVKRTLEPEVASQVAEVIKENKLSGFHFQEESKRYYTKNKLAAQVLGFVGTDDKGLEGIEASMDKYIKGKAIKQGNFFDARGNRMGQSGMNEVETPKMNTVYLTIDAKMQFILEKSLDEAIAKTHAASAAAILMNPKTGEILGMANRPTFDPNKFSQAAPEAFMNRSVAIIYEPGSVFKPIMGCAGLMEGVITPTTKFNDLGSIDVGGRRIRNWDGQGLGMVTFTDIIKYSLNTGMASLGLKLGGKRETEYAKKFGFGSPTGSDIPGEEAGILYNPDDMVPSDVATMGIGQGIAVSPLQMLRAICAIANGGELLKPYIVKKVESPDGKILQEGQKQVVRTVITPEVAEEMRGMMEKVVSEGGGKTAQIKGYKIAGKTGTAEKLSPNGGYIPGVYIASFVGFVPSDDPQYAMLIMLDSPKGAFYGSQVSAPIFRDTLQQILVAKGIQPSDSKGLPTVESLQRKDSGPTTLPQLTILDDGKVKLPNLAGYSMRSIAEVLQQGKLSLVPKGSGISWQQKPGPGAILSEGDTVEVWFR